MEGMTREQLVELLTDWFAWRSTTRVHNWHPHRGFYTWQTMDTIQSEWLSSCMSRELLPIAFDVWLNPPDLTQSKVWKFEESETWEPNEEFIGVLDRFVNKWWSFWPKDWLELMTPLLENQITLPPNYVNDMYVTARHRALSIIGFKTLNERASNQLYERLELLCAEWESLLEEEKGALMSALTALYYPPTAKGFKVLTQLKQKVDPLWIEDIESALRQEEGCIVDAYRKKDGVLPLIWTVE